MAGKLDITIEQGATYKRVVTVADAANVAINVGADTFRGQVRKSHKSANPLATFTMSLFTNGTDGKFVMELSDTVTAAMDEGEHVYDVEWVSAADGTVRRILEGAATVTPEVTK